jgi:ring-1,2-phenylacetyl-CoA epoxidase subunit PaaC
LDLLGQARLWFAYASEIEAASAGQGRSEDEFAFLRDGGAFRNLLLVEQPNGDYADTTARQFYFDQWHLLVLQALGASCDSRIAEIATKAQKEVAYHADRSADWVIRLGDGTDQSHDRMQAALDELWPYTGEMFVPDAIETALIERGIAADIRKLHEPWLANVRGILQEATLTLPSGAWMQGGDGRGGKQGIHTEHLGHLLCEMQFLQRAYPGLRW